MGQRHKPLSLCLSVSLKSGPKGLPPGPKRGETPGTRRSPRGAQQIPPALTFRSCCFECEVGEGISRDLSVDGVCVGVGGGGFLCALGRTPPSDPLPPRAREMGEREKTHCRYEWQCARRPLRPARSAAPGPGATVPGLDLSAILPAGPQPLPPPAPSAASPTGNPLLTSSLAARGLRQQQQQ